MISKIHNNSNMSYHAYLLKVWQEPDLKPTNHSWRFSLEDAHTGMRRAFNDLDSLLSYMQDLTASYPDKTE